MSVMIVPDEHYELFIALNKMLETDGEQKKAIHVDQLWKLVRGDNHGVMDCAADLRELHL